MPITIDLNNPQHAVELFKFLNETEYLMEASLNKDNMTAQVCIRDFSQGEIWEIEPYEYEALKARLIHD